MATGERLLESQGGGRASLTLSPIFQPYETVEIIAAGYFSRQYTAEEFSALTDPIVLLPGDIVDISGRGGPDGQLTQADYDAWLEAYRILRNPTITEEGRAVLTNAYDYTRDGVVNNLDFSLWLQVKAKSVSESTESL